MSICENDQVVVGFEPGERGTHAFVVSIGTRRERIILRGCQEAKEVKEVNDYIDSLRSTASSVVGYLKLEDYGFNVEKITYEIYVLMLQQLNNFLRQQK